MTLGFLMLPQVVHANKYKDEARWKGGITIDYSPSQLSQKCQAVYVRSVFHHRMLAHILP